MLSKVEITRKAYELGFDEIGFTTAEPFESQHDVLLERQEAYAHSKRIQMNGSRELSPGHWDV